MPRTTDVAAVTPPPPPVRRGPGPRRLVVAVAVGFTLLLIGVTTWQVVRRTHTSVFLDAMWTAAITPGVSGRITNWNGRPAIGQRVETVDAAGHVTAAAATDADGHFAMHPPAPASQLKVVDIDAIPLNRFNGGRDRGLRFDIQLKRPAGASRGPL